ncbi:MAG: phosphomannomutase [Desulfovibrio sp.]|nr:phosphomannomutase [Desulfovibrio sp.]
MSTALSCFKAYDIRGRVPEELNLELARQIGLAFAAEFAPTTVCIGRDARLSSRDISLVLANGLEDGGVEVVDIGLCGTEEVYHATFSQGFDGGIMITASHNPADWNGMKLVRAGAAPVSADSGLHAVRDRILSKDLPIVRKKGNTRRQTFRTEYTDHLLGYFGEKTLRQFAPLTIVINAGNGCAWLPIRDILSRLPCTIIPLHEEPDGTFPNGVPNPLLPENRRVTSLAVLRHRADIGVAFDGDFDRCFFFDEQGNFIEGYYVVGLIAATLLAEHPGETIIHDSRLVWNTQEMVLAAGGIPFESKAGHAFMKERMRAENALYGGEMSAHHYFRDFSHCDSGMLAWLLLYKLLSHSGKPLSELVKERMRLFPVSGEINRSVGNVGQILEAVRVRYEKTAKTVTFVDGLSVDMGDWRFNLRSSNTEPLLRLNVESRADPSLMEARRDELLALIR